MVRNGLSQTAAGGRKQRAPPRPTRTRRRREPGRANARVQMSNRCSSTARPFLAEVYSATELPPALQMQDLRPGRDDLNEIGGDLTLGQVTHRPNWLAMIGFAEDHSAFGAAIVDRLASHHGERPVQRARSVGQLQRPGQIPRREGAVGTLAHP